MKLTEAFETIIDEDSGASLRGHVVELERIKTRCNAPSIMVSKIIICWWWVTRVLPLSVRN
jgi:hypothetical protein